MSIRRSLQIALWLFIPLAILAAAELVFRARYPFPTHYWKPVERTAARGELKYLFLGNSQVACAIDTDAFAKELGVPTNSIVNAGMGWSVPFQHYLGLCRLEREHPDALRGCTVFLDAPAGLPVFGAFGNKLYSPERPDFLWGQVGWRELPLVWDAQPSWEQRSRLLASWLVGQSALLTRANQIGSGLVDKTRRKFVASVRGLRKNTEEPAAKPMTVDLSRAGGVRIDAFGVALVKDIVARNAERELRIQKPLGDWETTDLAAIVHLVHEAGAQVVFYRMPLHSAQGRVYDSDTRRADRARFRAQAEQWGTHYLEPDYHESDADFPDHLHLGASHAADFSRALARSWLAATR